MLISAREDKFQWFLTCTEDLGVPFFLVIFNYHSHSPVTGWLATSALAWLTQVTWLLPLTHCLLLLFFFFSLLPQKLTSGCLYNLDIPYDVTCYSFLSSFWSFFYLHPFHDFVCNFFNVITWFMSVLFSIFIHIFALLYSSQFCMICFLKTNKTQTQILYYRNLSALLVGDMSTLTLQKSKTPNYQWGHLLVATDDVWIANCCSNKITCLISWNIGFF